MISFDDSSNLSKINEDDFKQQVDYLNRILLDSFDNHSIGLGWHHLLQNYDEQLLTRIKDTTLRLQSYAKIMLVIGIGGSYLGSNAINNILNNDLNNEFQLIYVGQGLDSDYLNEVYNYVKDQSFVINVVSKSGVTLETSLAFRLFEDLMIKKYPDTYKERIVVTTSYVQSNLYDYSIKQKYEIYGIAKDIGGRYSVFSAVGLISLAFTNLNITEFVKGAIAASNDVLNKKSVAYRYAYNRFIQYNKGKVIVVLATYDSRMLYFLKWWQQLFGESEGKNESGLFPSFLVYSTDLHSMGQYIQEGPKTLFETVIFFDEVNNKLMIPTREDDFEHLNEAVSRSLHEINELACDAVIEAHSLEGNIPNLLFRIPKKDEYNLGYLMSTMMYACYFSALLIKVNPFDQPGVEVYKKEIKRKL